MLQNDEALYYGKPHLHYITPKTLVIIGVVSISVKVIILFLLLVANLIRGCTPKPNCHWLYPAFRLQGCSRRECCYHTLSMQNFSPFKFSSTLGKPKQR